MTESEKEAFIGGVEFARDWNFEIPPEDVLIYEKLIAEREEKRHEQSNIDGEAHERPEYQIHAAE
jgi:hypothetical protein